MRRRPFGARVVLILALCLAACSTHSKEPRQPVISAQLQALSDKEVDERLAYLEPKLDDGRLYATIWHRGWVAFYLLGVVVESYLAATTDDSAKRADYIVGAIKAPGGAFSLLWYGLRAQEGADPVRELPDATREDRLRRLALAEKLLAQDAKEAERRWSWKRHLLNVGINSAGALIVGEGFGDRERAWRSAGIGIGVGEVMIWSQPWEAPDKLAEYERRFGTSVETAPTAWQLDIVPIQNGAAVQVAF